MIKKGTLAAALSLIGGGTAFLVRRRAFRLHCLLDRGPAGHCAGACGGMLAQTLGAGFLGGIVSGFLAGYLTKFLADKIKLPPRSRA